ncbi:hypothetical protein [Cecembia calidifontis]|uniref:CRP-like cAMP-binding protein n=1 Tax=Cecembia calidifontis TaxID=1187080 RepID=A0A4Q7P895_9BACT|nr:hypothetical protein [Cecembia calidifontis]RZS95778.1 CRP-like cAMP-binding protein [Cecembia calidifontis]
MGTIIDYKVNILQYADKHGLHFEGLMHEIFPLTLNLLFKKGSPIKMINHKENYLIFIHSGQVYGTCHDGNYISSKKLITGKEIFLQGIISKEPLPYQCADQLWVAADRTEITGIDLELILKKLSQKEGAAEKLIDHIRTIELERHNNYLKVHNNKSIIDKLTFLYQTDPNKITSTKKYLAEYLNVTSQGLSKAMATWDKTYLV